MRLSTRLSILFLFATALTACQSEPKTDLERIDRLKKQVQADTLTLGQLQAKDFIQVKKDFIYCDSMLQYLHPEDIDDTFKDLQLVNAYLEQFKATQPGLKVELDSTLFRLDRLKDDVKSHYLPDSLATRYISDETQYVELLSNQVQYFKERLGSSKSNLNDIKKKL